MNAVSYRGIAVAAGAGCASATLDLTKSVMLPIVG